MTSLAVLFVAKLTVVLLSGAAITMLLRSRSASTRHLAWAVTIACSIVLALAIRTAPRVVFEVPAWAPAPQAAPEPETTNVVTKMEQFPVTVSPQAGKAQGEGPSPLLLLYLAGIAVVLTWLTTGHVKLAKILRNATPANDAHWSKLLDDATQEMDVTRNVRMLFSRDTAAPFTSGALRPVIVLPQHASAWPHERRRAAVLHEVAHIKRNDYLVHLLAGVAKALYWFHPAMWLAVRALRRESEQATDDLVIARGMIAPDYAAQLLEVASSASAPHFASAAAVGMACPSNLERRVTALLDETRPRGVFSARKSAWAILTAAALIVPFAGAEPQTSSRTRIVVRHANGDTITIFADDDDDAPAIPAVPPMPAMPAVPPVPSHASMPVPPAMPAAPHVEMMPAMPPQPAMPQALAMPPAMPPQPAMPSMPAMAPMPAMPPVPAYSEDVEVIHAADAPKNAQGVIEITKDGGQTLLDEAPHGAIITSGGGRVEIGRSGGDVHITTGGGRIRLGPVNGSVRASTGAGRIDIVLTDTDGSVNVTTGHGAVVIDLPAGYDGRFDLETAYTDGNDEAQIRSAWDLQHDPVTDWDAHQGTPRKYVRAHGSVGSGRGLIRIRAVNGDVVIRRN
ncbi:MAG TPA: M56 family metallopeptidase [Thermoanaerobaculia bacterium]|nr:M56 family metallopeptidase [Thermoanaerobaculia bacterium]